MELNKNSIVKIKSKNLSFYQKLIIRRPLNRKKREIKMSHKYDYANYLNN